MGAGGLLLVGILHESQSIHRAGMKSPTAVDLGPFGLTQTWKGPKGEKRRPRVLPQSYQLAA